MRAILVALILVSSAAAAFAAPASDMWFDRVPVYPAAHAQNLIRGGHTITFDFVTSDSVSAVFAFYRDRLTSQGWKVAGSTLATDGLCKLVLDHPGDADEFVVFTAIRVTDGITRVNVTSTREVVEPKKDQ